MKIGLKPDNVFWGRIYQLTDLPEQWVTETTDGKTRRRKGVEQCGPHAALVVSTQEFNDTQGRGLIIIPLTSAAKGEREKFGGVPQPTWVRVIFKGDAAFVLCEQIRYIDRGRCGKLLGGLADYDLRQVEEKLRTLLVLPKASL